jgi:hypothetical protein
MPSTDVDTCSYVIDVMVRTYIRISMALPTAATPLQEVAHPRYRAQIASMCTLDRFTFLSQAVNISLLSYVNNRNIEYYGVAAVMSCPPSLIYVTRPAGLFVGSLGAWHLS